VTRGTAPRTTPAPRPGPGWRTGAEPGCRSATSPTGTTRTSPGPARTSRRRTATPATAPPSIRRPSRSRPTPGTTRTGTPPRRGLRRPTPRRRTRARVGTGASRVPTGRDGAATATTTGAVGAGTRTSTRASATCSTEREHSQIGSASFRLGSDSAEYRYHAAQDGRVVTGDRLEGRVAGQQPDVAVPVPVRLDGRLTLDHRGHDLAVVGRGLLAHDHPVAVADRRLEHRVALDLEGEQGALTDQLPGQREDVLDRLLGQDRATGGDPPEQGYVRRGRPGRP